VGILRIVSLAPDKEMKIRAWKAKEKQKTEKEGDVFFVFWLFQFFLGGFYGILTFFFVFGTRYGYFENFLA